MEQFEIDAAGRVRDYQGTRLSRWQVSGRDFARELGWTVGAEAAERIARFRARGLDLDRFCAKVVTRGREDGVEITLRQGKGGATVVALQYARANSASTRTGARANPVAASRLDTSSSEPSMRGMPR